VRAYYEDTDAAGVVYYANYFRYFERARTEWLEALGHPPAELASVHGVVFVVRHVEADFRMPARLFDRLDVSVAVVSANRASVILAQSVHRAGELLVDARIRLASIASGSFKPVRIPLPLARMMADGVTSSPP